MKEKKGKIPWYSTSQNVDLDTGEIISNKEAKENYYLIKTIKNHNYDGKHGITEYTRWYKRKFKQLELF